MRNQTNYNKVVNVSENGEITVLDYTFDYGHMKGATGSKFVPVSKSEYEEQTSRDNILDYIMNSGMELPKEHLAHGFNGLVDAIIANGEEASVMYDLSYSELWGYLREECGLSEEEAHIFNCVGGGRCFEKDFQGNKNVELSAIIRQFES